MLVDPNRGVRVDELAGDELLARRVAQIRGMAVAERCQLKLDFGQIHLPQFEVPEGYTPETYLERLCREGLKRRYARLTPEVDERSLIAEARSLSVMSVVTVTVAACPSASCRVKVPA